MDSYESFPQVPSEDVILGTAEGMYLSPVRRFFCLLVTFDLLFTSLLWTLCVILVKGDHNLVVAFESEVVSYSLQISIFDTVMCAGSRFVILVLFYGLVNCRHWLPVALSTAGSCIFLVAKVLLFEWSEYGSGSPWPVLLVLSSFVLAWVEAWFLDFRVVPIERQAAIYLSRQLASSRRNNGTSLVGPWLGSQRARTPGGIRSYPDSVSQFYSPLESPYHSDSENESEADSQDRIQRIAKRNCESIESKMWIQQGPSMASELVSKIKSSGWLLEKSLDHGDNVYSKKFPRKIFMITGLIPASPKKILNELFHNVEKMPNWSPSVSYSELLQVLNEFTDITYQVSKEGAGGMISPRDFVTLRHHKILPDSSHVLAVSSVKHNDRPVQPSIIRGTNGVGGWLLSPSVINPRHTDFHWLLDVELELSRLIPSKVVDTAFISAALDTVNCLRFKLTYTVEPVENFDIQYPVTSIGQQNIISNPETTLVAIDGAAS